MLTKSSKFDGYNHTIDPDDEIDDDEDDTGHNGRGKSVNVQQYFDEMAERADPVSGDPFADKRTRQPTIAERERGTYNERRQKLQLSPGVRYDPFAEGSQTPDLHSVRRTTAAVMRETQVLNEKKDLEMKMREKAKAGELKVVQADNEPVKKKRRWDQAASGVETNGSQPVSAKDMETPVARAIWDATPGPQVDSGATTPPDLSSGFSETPRVGKSAAAGRRRWDETPKTERGGETSISGWAETPKVERMDSGESAAIISKQAMLNEAAAAAASKKRSRWDETPVAG